MNAWHLTSLVFTLISLLLLLIALGSDYWVDIGLSHSGIWKLCVDYPGVSVVCASYGMDVAGHIHATRAFLILGVLAGFASTGLLCALFFRSEIGSYSIIKIAYSFNNSAGVFALLAMAVFTGVEGASSYYSWSFGLGWACGPLFLIAGGLTYKLQMDTRATA